MYAGQIAIKAKQTLRFLLKYHAIQGFIFRFLVGGEWSPPYGGEWVLTGGEWHVMRSCHLNANDIPP